MYIPSGSFHSIKKNTSVFFLMEMLRKMRTSRKGRYRFAIRSGAKESQATLY